VISVTRRNYMNHHLSYWDYHLDKAMVGILKLLPVQQALLTVLNPSNDQSAGKHY
jgi:hypothetical protein